MKEWYSNKKAGIFFGENPQIGVRYILPSMSEGVKKSVTKYPFINKTELKVLLADYKNNKKYDFTIPKGYCYDGASIPRLFWRLVGSNSDNSFLVAALVHDVLCENHAYVNNDRVFSTEVFNALLEASDVSPLKRFCMKHSVNCYQKFCHW